MTRDEILDHLWGADHAAGSNVVDRHVRNLRAKLADDWQRPRYIATVPGRGYRFLPTDTDPGEGPAAPPPGARPATSSRPAPAPASAALRATARSQPSAGTRRV